jgi:hypothetical protein
MLLSTGCFVGYVNCGPYCVVPKDVSGCTSEISELYVHAPTSAEPNGNIVTIFAVGMVFSPLFQI